MSQKQQLVLVCPLDWGLGHASRMIPVIERFIACGYQVILGGAGKSGDLLKTTFPQLTFIPMSSPVIRYPCKRPWLIPALIWQLPTLLFAIIHEHRLVKKIVITNGVNIVVSDNRYGLFCRHAYSIFITHQISPVLPALFRWMEYPLYLIIRSVILKYDECWVPDYANPQHNLSGKLSHRFKLPINARYVGIMSRFNIKDMGKEDPLFENYDLVVVLSGPEPQLGVINDLVIHQALTIPIKTLVISGLRKNPMFLSKTSHKQLTIVSHLETGQFASALLHAKLIVCRSGYSGIMDLIALGKTAVLVPTPGQPEQEYLAGYLLEKGWFSTVLQHKLDLGILMQNMGSQTPFYRGGTLNKHETLPIPLLSKNKHDYHSQKPYQKT